MSRQIRKSRRYSRDEVRELLESLFAIELIRPSSAIWVTAPWVSDIEIMDNSAGSYSVSELPQRKLTLSDLLLALAKERTDVVIAISDERSNPHFVNRLQRLFESEQLHSKLTIYLDDLREFHDKSIISDDFVLTGSMNFTHSGMARRGEELWLHTDGEVVSQSREDALDRFPPSQASTQGLIRRAGL